ncbi:MAG: DUF3267 domain-containing protein [Clostridium perfringens]|uniref:DUF3267 domain-containing protein n=1 Tax=Clostridium perfringens TaxID=1502 RepID=UPI0011234BF7|nr:DUF3267 domain-containing protein [Clostridium perfringens]EGT5620333.1 DUF3267 domain-containing protein [Clostridium perfringens]EIF6156859.1 DUF3267 domain-containing protein [Clostridium perfringens]EJT5921200.1 DUF3267 domain-containing protein [Clostridium perfringens]ELP5180181.1 DUF3267 domain-containing protein [Clostridium perfringens]ELP5182977.1 DUF3267 domain-containing protein [Clostridium perfringens]
MKLIWKGKFNGVEDLPIGELPKNAVRFEEPESAEELAKETRRFLIPVVIFLLIVIFLRIKINGFFGVSDVINIFGIILIPFSILPHEYLHAIFFPKDAEVEMWYSIKQRLALVTSTTAITKKRFIFLSLFPNIVFGFLPLIIWIFIPSYMSFISGILFTFGFISLIMGVGDFMNIYNTIKQVPKGAMTQISGFNSYWFFKEK